MKYPEELRGQSRWGLALLLVGVFMTPGCSIFFNYPDGTDKEVGQACSDDKDNDFDGKVDCQDTDCKKTCNEALHCDDSTDNDRDGLTDCDDPECVSACEVKEKGEPLCRNGKDDDFDGKTDCEDPSCDGSCSEHDLIRCSDARDNDGDGLIDAQDLGCWSKLTSTPRVTRCAWDEPVEFFESFEVSPGDLNPRCARFGNVDVDTWNRRGRKDGALTLRLQQKQGPPGGVVTRYPFPGPAELSLDAELFADRETSIVVALMPAKDLDPAGVASGDFGDAPITVSLLRQDTSRFQLRVGATVSQREVPTGPFHLHLETGEQGTMAVLENGTEDSFDLNGPPTHLPAFGVVVWMDQPEGAFASPRFDDLFLRAIPNRVCEVQEPQIWSSNGSVCPSELPYNREHLGDHVSLAVGTLGTGCALVSHQDTDAGRIDRMVSFTTSDEGRTFSEPKGDIVLEATTLTGLSVSWEVDHWLAVMGTRDSAGDHLVLMRSDNCSEWEVDGQPDLGQALSPNILTNDSGGRQILFFRRGGDEGEWELWQVSAEGGEDFGEPEEIGPIDPKLAMDIPVAMTRAGGDLAILFPSASQVPGGQLTLATASLASPSDWEKVLASIVAVPADALAFDSNRLLSGSVVWQENDGVLLYGGLGTPFGFHSAGTLSGTVGTARLDLPDQPSPTLSLSVACGDDELWFGENCRDCPSDCPEGTSSLLDMGSVTGWINSGAGHVSVLADRVVARWDSESEHRLSSPLSGNFRLGFDLSLASLNQASLSTPDDFEIGLVASGTDHDGIFVRLVKDVGECKKGHSGLGLETRSGAAVQQSYLSETGIPVGCLDGTIQFPIDSMVHVTLSREAGQIVLGVADTFGCIMSPVGGAQVELDGLGGLDQLDRLRVGGLGKIGTVSYAISNITSSQPQCPNEGEICSESDSSTCVRLQSDPSHCGSCSTACQAGEACEEGKCQCTAGLSRCGPDCIDLMQDIRHCGSCDNMCEDGALCVRGACTKGTCESPIYLERPDFSGEIEMEGAAKTTDSCELGQPSMVRVLSWTAPDNGWLNVEVGGEDYLQWGFATSCDTAPKCVKWNVETVKKGTRYLVYIYSTKSVETVNLSFVDKGAISTVVTGCCAPDDPCGWSGDGVCQSCGDAEGVLNDSDCRCCAPDDPCGLAKDGVCNCPDRTNSFDDSVDCAAGSLSCMIADVTTCSELDPCGWAGDGFCDIDCYGLLGELAFDDSQDCGATDINDFCCRFDDPCRWVGNGTCNSQCDTYTNPLDDSQDCAD